MKLFEYKLPLFLFVTPFFAGLYYEHLSCAAVLILVCFLLADRKRCGCLRLPRLELLLLCCSVPLFYVLSVLWAVDRGMAAMGFPKFLVLPLFVLCACQQTKHARTTLRFAVPLCGACMTAICTILSVIPALQEVFFVSGRLAGCFQYPNTFALFLLAGVILLAEKGYRKPLDILQLAVLLAGIALSGSRTVFFLLLLTAVAFILFGTEARLRWLPTAACGMLLACTLLYAVVTGNLSTVGRYLTSSFQSSTLQGRILYWQDALPVILRHPLGLGYMGYSFLQSSFQTGVYSVTFVHNDWLQLALDIGWLPPLLLLVTTARAGFSPKNDLIGRLLLLSVALHCVMDFDLQFPVIWFLLFLGMDRGCAPGEKCLFRPCRVPALLLAVLCLYFGTVSVLYYGGHTAACVRLHPGHTQALLAQLRQTDTLAEAEGLADRILRGNDTVSLAWSTKARAAFSAGDMTGMMEYKERALTLARYSTEEYLDYFQMLYTGYQLYVQAGDTASAEICRQKLLAIPRRMDAVLADTSPRGWRIQDLPELTLPAEYQAILKVLTD